VKQNYVSHIPYTTSNVVAAMERVMDSVHPGIVDPNDSIGPKTFPMTTADQAALGDPLSDFWLQGASPLAAQASGTPTIGNAPLTVSFTGSATGGTAPYVYSWDFGDGTASSTAQNPSHIYTSGGTYTATLTVTDNTAPATTTTAKVTVTVGAIGGPLAAKASAIPTSGEIPLVTAFTGSAAGGTPPYTYSWNFGDGSAPSSVQNPTHSYKSVGTYTATLVVTDSSAPAHSAKSTVTITATPLEGGRPSAPRNLAASAGKGLISLKWMAPASNGGVDISHYRVYRRTGTGTLTLLTQGGCSNLGAVLTCTDSGLTNGRTYFYVVRAANPIGTGPQSNEASASP
jgi:PKD repeat protein